MTIALSSLEAAFRRASPRLNPKAATPAGVAIFAAAVVFWGIAIVSAFRGEGLAAFAVGVASIAFDFTQLSFVAVQARKLFSGRGEAPDAWATPSPLSGEGWGGGEIRRVFKRRLPPSLIVPREGGAESRRAEPFVAASSGPAAPLTLSVIVAAYNEARALPATLDRLLAQKSPADQILIADDGSSDETSLALAARYGLERPRVGGLSTSPQAPNLSWLRLPHRGKARTLNAALEGVTGEIVVTVDADTLLDAQALGEIRRAFAADPDLIVGGGVLEPRCRGGAMGAVLQTFQRYEYVRNFMGRFAWSELDALLLISGAFAAFRTTAVREVGGFDPECLVEDYELIHRLHRRAREAGRAAKVRIIGRAFATTDAPASIPAFLRQRRRWFAGFLQTQYWNRDMIAAPRFGALGLAMLPVKCLDAAQPFYGLAAFALLLGFALSGRWEAFLPATGITLAKIAIDSANLAYLLEAHRRWTGGRARRRLALGLLCILVEPFTFQPLRYLGAARGWASLLAGDMGWGRLSRRAAAPSPE